MIKKKYSFIFAIALCSCGFAFSQEQTAEKNTNAFSLSAGAGGTFSLTFDIEKVLNSSSPYILPEAGFLVFFDATYAEAIIDMRFGTRRSFAHPIDPANSTTSLTHLGFSLYGKYPFHFSRLALYPMFGIEYRLFLHAQVYDADGNKFGGALERGSGIGGGYTAEDQFDMLSLGLGLGLDFSLPKSFFIRGEFVFKYTFDSTIAGDRRETARKYNFEYSSLVLGPCINLMLGYRFYH